MSSGTLCLKCRLYIAASDEQWRCHCAEPVPSDDGRTPNKISKADYVRSQPQTREHHCHWPDCDKQVPPAMWGCKTHWFRLPKNLRDRIWATYRPGQEKTMTPSASYLHVAKQVQEWIATQVKS